MFIIVIWLFSLFVIYSICVQFKPFCMSQPIYHHAAVFSFERQLFANKQCRFRPHLEVWNAQSLPPVPSSDTCGRLCIYMWMKTLRQSRYPPKSLRHRGLWLVFVVCFIVFISIILNVAHHSLLSEYTKMRCKDTNFLSYKHQNARKFIHIYDSLTLKQAFFRIFGCKFNRYQWYLPNFATIRPNSTLNDISPQKSFLFIVPKSFSSLTLFTIGLFRTRPADIDTTKVAQSHLSYNQTS